MNDYKEELKEQLGEINALIAKTERSLSKYRNLPDHRIRVGRSNGCDQYFWEDRATGKRTYVRSSESETLKKAAQRDYETLINKRLKRMKIQFEQFLKHYDIYEIENTYNKMAGSRKKLIVPVIEPGDSFLEKWRRVSYSPMPIENETEFYSGCGIRVRSKSELLIADMLEKKEIPYRYEYPLHLDNAGNIRPDFLCLNVRTRKEFIWEHFGMMDNIAYSNKNVHKIQNYGQNGYFAGKNLILTFETSQYPISSVIIKKTIEEYLL